MSDLQRRSGSGLSRRQREQRAYRLVVASGALGVVAVVGVVLAVIGVVGFGLPFHAAVLSAVAWLLFRRTLAS
jgi:hypothetical protein